MNREPFGLRMESSHQDEPVSNILENPVRVDPTVTRPIPHPARRFHIVEGERPRVGIDLPTGTLKAHRKISRTAHHKCFIEPANLVQRITAAHKRIWKRVYREEPPSRSATLGSFLPTRMCPHLPGWSGVAYTQTRFGFSL